MARNYKWWVVAMLWLVCFFNYADRQAIVATFPKLKQEFGFDPVELGVIGSAFMWVYAFGAPFAGYVVDRFPRKHLILGGCLFWSAVTATTGWCTQLWQFALVRGLSGLGETFYYPASMSLTSDYHGPRTRSKAFSLHQSSVYIGTIAGSWLGAWFAQYYGWQTGFYFFGIAGIVVALFLFRFLREPVRGAADHLTAENAAADLLHAVVHKPHTALGVADAARMIFGKPTTLLLMVVFLGANFVATIFLTWTPTFLVEKFGFQLTTAGLYGSLFIQLASAFSAPVGGILADSFARHLAGGRMLVQAIGLLGGASFVALVGLTNDVSTLIVGMIMFGLCKGLYDSNIFASLYDVIEPSARGTAAGLMNTVGWGGGALGPLAVGIATKYGRHATEAENMSEAIAYCSIIYVAGAVLLLTAIFSFARRDILRPALHPA